MRGPATARSSGFTKFVVLTTQRTGSGWVIDMLDSHPAITAYTEMFVQGGRGIPTGAGCKDLEYYESYVSGVDPAAAEQPSQRERLVHEYLDQIFAERPGVAAAGMKLMYGQARAYPEIGRYLGEKQVAIIHLIRSNLLRVLVSREVAWARDLWHARAGEHVPEPRIRLHVESLPGALERLEKEVRQARARYEGWPAGYLEIFHEELASSHTHFEDVLAFLGVPRGGRLESTFVRLVTAPLSAVVENYAEVERVVGASRFSSFLDE